MIDTKKTPLVSVIMPAHNDAKYIKKAIYSVLNQTLHDLEIIVVDDASTDNTLEVVEKISLSDPRVRFDGLPKNTGAAGAPRNRGIELARGKYIFFFDSDDELDRHALKNLYYIAQRDKCDFVMGKTVRYNLVGKNRQVWLGYLFREDVVNTSVEETPELLDDVLITNKLYKRTFIIDNKLYFEEGIHYEDVIYSALVFTRAKKISITKDEIYIWNVYDTNVRKSISNQRDSIKSLEDRLYANERRTEIYEKLNNLEINKRCRIHFLKHSAMLYLMDASDYDDNYLDKIINLLRPVVAALPMEYFNDIGVQNRVIYGLLLLKDKQGLRELSYYRKYGNKFAGKILRKSENTFWVSSTTTNITNSKPAKDLLNVSKYHLADIPVSSLTYYHELKKIYRSGNKLILEGVSQDPLGKFNFKNGINSSVVIEKRDNPNVKYQYKVDFTQDNKGAISWAASIPNFNFSMRHGYEPWNISLKLAQEDRDNQSPIHVSNRLNLKKSTIYSFGPVRSSIGCGLTTYRMVNGDLALRHSEFKQMSKAMGAYKRLLAYENRVRNIFRRINKAMTLRVWYPAFRKLPINRRTILFESQLGQMATGSPVAVYREALLDERFNGYKFIWSSEKKTQELDNARTSLIRRNSMKYFWYLATACILVDDQTFPGYFEKRAEQVYLQTWHGIALKKMGLDEPSIQRSEAKVKDTIKRAAMWNGLIAPSAYFVDTFVKAFRYKGQLVKWGTPRNDKLYNATQKNVDEIRKKLDLPEGRKIILYAPTFREHNKGQKFKIPIDLHAWSELLGGDVYLLIRTHYLNAVHIPKSLAPFCMNVSDYPDLDDLYIASDVMVTDYSSTMFDYATLKRPMLFYTFDYDNYMNSERGAYFDLKMNAPGPVMEDQEALLEAIKDVLKQKSPTKRYLKFVEDFCGIEDGFASKRAVNFIASEVKK